MPVLDKCLPTELAHLFSLHHVKYLSPRPIYIFEIVLFAAPLNTSQIDFTLSKFSSSCQPLVIFSVRLKYLKMTFLELTYHFKRWSLITCETQGEAQSQVAVTPSTVSPAQIHSSPATYISVGTVAGKDNASESVNVPTLL